MPKTTSFGEQPLPVANGPCVQDPVPASVLNFPATLAASGTAQSNLINSDGYQKIAVGLTSSQNGSLSVLRYIDNAGTILQTQATATTITGGTAAVNNVTDGLPFASFRVQLTNTGGSTANITNVAVLMQSQ